MMNHEQSTPAGENRVCAPEQSAEQRVEVLELEVARLQNELAELQALYSRDRALLDARTIRDMPKTEEEFLQLVKEGRPFRELLDELEHKLGLDQKL